MRRALYNCKTYVALFAMKTISKSFADHIELLSSVRDNWTAEYAADLEKRIDETIREFMAVDKKKDLRQATGNLMAMQLPAMRDLSAFRTQVMVDFPEEADEMLLNLGFGQFFKKARKFGQEALVANLTGFRKGMTDELKNRVIAKGLKADLIDRIITYTDNLLEANAQQEFMKESTKAVTEETQKAINDLYDEVGGICKIARAIFRFDPVLRTQFSFYKVVSNMGQAARQSVIAPAPEPEIPVPGNSIVETPGPAPL